MQMKDTKPRFSGTFVQPSLCEKWTVSEWEQHYERLLEAGMDIMILQWVAETPGGKFSYVGYESETAKANSAAKLRCRADFLQNALEAAENKGVKVFVGLNFAEEWWSGAFREDAWIRAQTELGNAMAKEIYTRFKGLYPNALYGWYFVWEMYNDTNGDEKYWTRMLNPTLACLSAIDPALPVLLSPFISGHLNKTPEETGAMWKRFFALAEFRPGDIFCSQDSVGASQFPIDFIEEHIAQMKKAADTKPYVRFWINIENFSGKSGEGAAPLERVKKQMDMASRYAQKLVTFSYSHYYLDGVKKNAYHEQYLRYLKGGNSDG